MGNKTTSKRKIGKNKRKRLSQIANAAKQLKAQQSINNTVDSTCTNNYSNDDTLKSNENPTEPIRKKENTFGRRIINLSHFFKQLQKVASHGPMNCGLESVDIIRETRTGLNSLFKLKCKMCNATFSIYNDNTINEMDVNTSAVAGTVAIGCGYSQLTELSAAIGLVPMSKKVFSTKLNVVNKKWKNQLNKSMAEAAEQERSLAIKESRVNSDGVAIIDVIADGCYSKRSYKKNYTSLSGAAAIIGKRSNKILYLGIRNKYCCICAVAQTKNVLAKDHTCYKNYKGPSTGMESEILVEGFKKSLSMHNLIYGRLISDGDANTYSKILQARPYNNLTVEKVECRNHLLRNLCNKLVAISTDTKYVLKYRKHITKKRILCLRKVIVNSIKNHKDSGDVKSLHQDIINAPDHAFGRHCNCKDYYCTKTENDKEITNDMFSNIIWQRVKLIIMQLAAHVRSLIVDVDSNSVERYHSIVAKFVGGKRINFCNRFQYQMRCNAAALSFNTRRPLSILHMSFIGESPQNEIKRMEEKNLKNRQLTEKYLRKKRRVFHYHQDMRNYGDDCSKPDMDEDMLAQSKQMFLQSLVKTNEEREKIFEETVLQSGSSEWLELRRNILTASNFGRVIKRRMNFSCQNIVKDILYKESIDHVPSIKHGRESEKLAVEQLALQEHVVITPCGLHIDPVVPYFGASPDGIIGNNMIVEIKCPKTTYKVGVEKALEGKKLPFYKKNKEGIFEINKEHNWYYQMQGQLHVTRREKCLFGLWSGDNFPVKVETIERDDEFWSNKMENKLKQFYLDCLLPELVDPRYTRKMPIRDPVYIKEAIEKKERQQKSLKRKHISEKDQQDTVPKRQKNIMCD